VIESVVVLTTVEGAVVVDMKCDLSIITAVVYLLST